MKLNNYHKAGIVCALIICIGISMMMLASAEYLPHQQNTNFTLTITSNNATACNLSSIQYPDGTSSLFNLVLTKDGQTFYKTIASGNYSQLGTTCHLVSCTDGTTQETGSVCREVTPSGNSGSNNSAFIILVFALIYGIAFVGFFGKNEWVAILGGMAMLGLGIYTINSGIIVYQDAITKVLSWTTIGLGAFFSLFTGLELINDNL